jgi:DNA-binding NtrC family response regulator
MPTILIADDDTALREALTEAVRDLGYGALEASTGEIALSVVEQQTINAVILDLRMPGIDGLEVLRQLRTRAEPLPVAVLTAYANANNTIEAMRLGAFDHLTKPIGRADLERVLNGMLATNIAQPKSLDSPIQETLVGSSETMRQVQKTIGMLADNNATVLITGETGTGKELVARAIHDHGCRNGKKFVAVNCAAIPSELLESELFGHVRGAFTGAVGERLGAFRQADSGSLFLDEIGDMNLSMQAKILRALQERLIIPVGGNPVPVDVRVIAATHRDIPELVHRGLFREDLFYRLHVVPIHIPPLRDRIADIIPLAEYFLARADGGRKRLTSETAARLIKHNWPGNARELKNAMERVAVLVYGDWVKIDDIHFLDTMQPALGQALDWPDEDLPAAVARLEKLLIQRALQKANENRAEAARILNIHRQLLYSKMQRYGIEVSENKTDGVTRADTKPIK